MNGPGEVAHHLHLAAAVAGVLLALLAAAHQRETPRKATRPSRAAKAKRVDVKARRGAVKKGRGRPGMEG